MSVPGADQGEGRFESASIGQATETAGPAGPVGRDCENILYVVYIQGSLCATLTGHDI